MKIKNVNNFGKYCMKLCLVLASIVWFLALVILLNNDFSDVDLVIITLGLLFITSLLGFFYGYKNYKNKENIKK